MRVALLSDIHGNAPALRAVLEDAHEQKAEAIWFLGDVLGYGPLPVTCLHLLKSNITSRDVWLIGNHDRGVFHLLAGKSVGAAEVRRMAPGQEERYLLAWHALQVRAGDEEAWVTDLLKKAPTWQKAAEGIYTAHGAILKLDQDADENIEGNAYCHPGQPTADVMLSTIKEKERPALIVVGHTHRPTLGYASRWEKPRRWEWHESNEFYESPDKEWSWLREDGRGPVLLCPGSVGQPRYVKDTQAAYYALLDTEQKTIHFRRVAYPYEEFLAAMALFLDETGKIAPQNLKKVWESVIESAFEIK